MAPVLADDAVVEAARVDTRPRARRLLAPLLTLAGSGAALAYLAVVDPNEPGHYPLCPTRALFGIDCPGCGLLRGTHELVTGNVAAALDNNLMLVVIVPLLAVLWARWAVRSWRGTSPEVTYGRFRRRNAWIIAGVVAMLVFGVVRNLTPYLGSGLG
jgi:hypothetical protein